MEMCVSDYKEEAAALMAKWFGAHLKGSSETPVGVIAEALRDKAELMAKVKQLKLRNEKVLEAYEKLHQRMGALMVLSCLEGGLEDREIQEAEGLQIIHDLAFPKIEGYEPIHKKL